MVVNRVQKIWQTDRPPRNSKPKKTMAENKMPDNLKKKSKILKRSSPDISNRRRSAGSRYAEVPQSVCGLPFTPSVRLIE